MFPLARKSLSTNWNTFKHTFPLDRKIKLALAGESQNRRRKKLFPLAGIGLFSKIGSPDFHKQNKNLEIKEYCFN